MSTSRGPLTWFDVGVLILRRWWWIALLVVPFAAMALSVTLQNPSIADWMLLLLVNGIAIDTALLARQLPSNQTERWQRAVDRQIAGSWPALAEHLGLAVRSRDGAVTIAGLGRSTWQEATCVMTVRLPAGLGREHLVAQASLIGEAFGALRASVDGNRIDALTLRPVRRRSGQSGNARCVGWLLPQGGPSTATSFGHSTLVARRSGSSE